MELGIFIGMVTFVGSVAACYKLDGKLKTPHFGSFAALNAILMVISIVLMVLGGVTAFFDKHVREYFPPAWDLSWGWAFNLLLVVVAMIYGLCFVLPIGGADMPVVISVLNAFSGISGCTAVFQTKFNRLAADFCKNVDGCLQIMGLSVSDKLIVGCQWSGIERRYKNSLGLYGWIGNYVIRTLLDGVP